MVGCGGVTGSRSGAKSEPARSSQRGGTSLHWGLRLRRETDRERTRYSQPAEPELAPLPEPFQRAAGGAACTATGDPSGSVLAQHNLTYGAISTVSSHITQRG